MISLASLALRSMSTVTIAARVEVSQQRRGISHLAGVVREPLGRQEACTPVV